MTVMRSLASVLALAVCASAAQDCAEGETCLSGWGAVEAKLEADGLSKQFIGGYKHLYDTLARGGARLPAGPRWRWRAGGRRARAPRCLSNASAGLLG